MLEELITVKAVLLSQAICDEYASQIAHLYKKDKDDKINAQVNNKYKDLPADERERRIIDDYSELQNTFTDLGETSAKIKKNLVSLGIDQILAFMHDERSKDTRYKRLQVISVTDVALLVEYTPKELTKILKDYYTKYKLLQSDRPLTLAAQEGGVKGTFFSTLCAVKHILVTKGGYSHKALDKLSINEFLKLVSYYNAALKVINDNTNTNGGTERI